MSAVLLIGIGNPDRGDDGAGRLVAAAIRGSGLEVCIVERMGGAAELLDAWEDAESVVVVDAVASGARPGTLHVFDALDGAPSLDLSGGSTHGMGLGEAIGLGKALRQIPRRLVVIGIEGRNFEPGAALSAEVREALPLAVERAREELTRMIHA